MRASIDIGTNTALLLVAEVKNGKLKVNREEQRVPRLGKGVDESRQLSKDAIDRVIANLEDFQQIIKNDYPSVDSIKVTATSAVRDARNRDFFLDSIAQKTGLIVQVLSGFEEAKYTFLGAQSVITNEDNSQKVVIDIGGGSTEIAYGGDRLKDHYSYDVGCVRFTERYLEDNHPAESQIFKCREAIQRILRDYEFNFADDAKLIGVAGTVTSLAYIDLGLDLYDRNALSGYILSLETISDYVGRFKEYPSETLLTKYPSVMEGRADIFLAGLLILEEFMKKYGFQELFTSMGGIRHGVTLNPK